MSDTENVMRTAQSVTERLYGDKTWKQIVQGTFITINMLIETKGVEYKASDIDELANFRRRAERLGLPIEAVWGIYAGKHIDAIETYIKDIITNTNRFRSEPIVGRIDDAIMYLILFKAMVAEREHNKT